MIVFGKHRDYIIHDDYNIKGFFGPYRFLSNYHVADVLYEGIIYPSSEHAYHAAKTLDINIRKELLTLTCAEAKKKGNIIPLRSDWEEIKYDVMKTILRDKFTRHRKLRSMLLNTGGKYLEETNHWRDTYWGVCDEIGENNLGKILMYLRFEIKRDRLESVSSEVRKRVTDSITNRISKLIDKNVGGMKK